MIVILGHDSCGAVKATLAALDDGALPGGYIRDLVERVTPSILLGRREGLTRPDEFEARHVVETGTQLFERSSAIAAAVAAGELAIVGATYHLADGRVVLRNIIGDRRATRSTRNRCQNELVRYSSSELKTLSNRPLLAAPPSNTAVSHAAVSLKLSGMSTLVIRFVDRRGRVGDFCRRQPQVLHVGGEHAYQRLK